MNRRDSLPTLLRRWTAREGCWSANPLRRTGGDAPSSCAWPWDVMRMLLDAYRVRAG